MKKFNLKLMTPLALTLILQGCMPDSLTKFKKDTPKKTTASSVTSGSTTAPGSVVDPGTGSVFVPTLPSYFYYFSTSVQDKAVTIGSSFSFLPTWDGTLADATKASALQPTCEAFDVTSVRTTLTTSTNREIFPGVVLDKTTCKISGIPTSLNVQTSSGNEGKAKKYEIDLTYLNATGTAFLTKIAYINIGAYYRPSNLSYSQDDKIILNVTAGSKGDLTLLEGAVDSSALYDADINYVAASNSTVGVIKYIDTTNSQIGLNKPFLKVVDKVGSLTDPVSANQYVDNNGDLQSSLNDKVLTVDTTSGISIGQNIISSSGGSAQVLEFNSSTNAIRIHMATSADSFIATDYICTVASACATHLATVSNVSYLIGKIAAVDTSTSLTKVYIEKFSNILRSSVVELNALYGTLDHTSLGLAQTSVVWQPVKVTNINNFVLNGPITTLDYTKSGTVRSFDVDSNILYIEMLVADVFRSGDKVDYSASTPSAVPSYVIQNYYPPMFTSAASELDTNSAYFESKFTINKVTRTYPVSTTSIEAIQPEANITVNAYNGVVYYISPQLPAGLFFSSSTGTISGKFLTAFAPTNFTIYATNPLDTTATTSAVTTLVLSAIKAPTDLILTDKQIITVNDNTPFVEGEDIFTYAATGSDTSYHGKVLKIFNDGAVKKLAIQTYNGTFLAGALLDSGNAYYLQKAYIKTGDPVYYNLTLTVADTTGFLVNASIKDTTSGAYGRVAGIDSINGILFVQFLTPTPASVATFSEGDTIIDSNAPATTTSIEGVESEFMKLGLTITSGTFLAGTDITSSNRGSGYIYNKDTSGASPVISISDISKNSLVGFRTTQTIDNAETFTTGNATITSVTHDNFYTIQRGVASKINASLYSGSSVSYSIAPALPSGLTLNATTGVISGTAPIAMPKKDFIITAINNVGLSQVGFSLEVRDYFSLAELSNAPSFLLHKVGANQNTRKCRINANDIVNNSGAVLDIRCNLEGQEEDLYYNSIKLEATIGSGVCQYIQYSPYYFWNYNPLQSNGGSVDPTTRAVVWTSGTVVRNGCVTDPIPTTDLCSSNYAAYGASGPNCDEGYITYISQAYADPGTGCVASGAATTVKLACGGKKTNCIAGPIKDLLDDSKLSSGYRSLIYQSPNGTTLDWTLSTPISKGDSNNLRVANSVTQNKCSSSNADVNTWTTKMSSTSNTASPFGQTNPYYIVNCLDAASQIKARIRVTVRDWDRSFRSNYNVDLDDPSSSSVATYRIATDGVPFMNSSSARDTFGVPWNNYNDWDNDYTSAGTCSTAGLTTEFTCVLNGVTWTAAGASYTFGGTPFTCGTIPSCTDSTYNNKPDCIGSGATWRGTEFPYPQL